jgi:hypothetical protein
MSLAKKWRLAPFGLLPLALFAVLLGRTLYLARDVGSYDRKLWMKA